MASSNGQGTGAKPLTCQSQSLASGRRLRLLCRNGPQLSAGTVILWPAALEWAVKSHNPVGDWQQCCQMQM